MIFAAAKVTALASQAILSDRQAQLSVAWRYDLYKSRDNNFLFVLASLFQFAQDLGLIG